MDFEFFDACFYIPNTNIKNFKIMNLTNKRIFFIPSINNGVYALTIFELTNIEIDSLIAKMTKHFHLSPKQQEPMALAA